MSHEVFEREAVDRLCRPPPHGKPLQISTKKKKQKKLSFFQRISKRAFSSSFTKKSPALSAKKRRGSQGISRSSSTSSLKRTAVVVSGVQRHSRSRTRGGRSVFSCTGGQRSRSCTPERHATTSCQLPVSFPPELLQRLQQERESSLRGDIRRAGASNRCVTNTTKTVIHSRRQNDYSDEDDDTSENNDDDDVDDDADDEVEGDSGVDDGEYSGSIDKFKCDIAMDNYLVSGTRASSGRSTLKSSVYTPSALSDSDYSPTCVEDVNMDFSKMSLAHPTALSVGKRLSTHTKPHQPLLDVTNARNTELARRNQSHDCTHVVPPSHVANVPDITLSANHDTSGTLLKVPGEGVEVVAKDDKGDSDKPFSIFSFSRFSFKRNSKKKEKKDSATQDSDKPGDGVFLTPKPTQGHENENDYTETLRIRSKTVMEQQCEHRQSLLRSKKGGRDRLRSHSDERPSSSSRRKSEQPFRQSSEPPDLPPARRSMVTYGGVGSGALSSIDNSGHYSKISRPSQYSTVGSRGMKGRPLPPIPGEVDTTSLSSCQSGSTLLSQPSSHQLHSAPAMPYCVKNAPPQGQITLVKTIQLEKVVKNKWISGLAVTRKNEYVIVDLKEAYLVDDQGNLKRTIGAKGNHRLQEPIDVAVMSNGNLVFSDHAGQDVKIFNGKGQFCQRVCDDTLTNIAGVATTDRNEIVIAGTDKQRVSVHSEHDELVNTIQLDKDGRCLFEHPYTVAVNPLTRDIIVGDDSKQLVSALSPDGKRVLWRYSPSGGRDRHFFPSSICVDNDGYVFIADLYNEKVYMLDTSGKFLKTLLSRGDGLKGGPGAIAVDGRGHLLVADEERTIKVFRYGENGFALYRRIKTVATVTSP